MYYHDFLYVAFNDATHSNTKMCQMETEYAYPPRKPSFADKP